MAFIDIENMVINVGMTESQKVALRHSLENQLEHISAQIRQIEASTQDMVLLDDGIATMTKAEWLVQANIAKAELSADLANI